ncbi:hypothetical protein [Streptomyces niveus]|uniref:hypothetical protein n=1 Tax=Streptomyces niveus TaxID=193462 RepID=UPI003666A3EE
MTLTGRYIRPDGTPLKGTVTFATPALLTLSGADTFSAGTATAQLGDDGSFFIILVATDNANMQPTEWAYVVTERFQDVTGRTYAITLPSTTPTVDLADIAPADPSQGNYVLVPGPTGPPGASILTGTGAPVGGSNGDFWIDVTPGAVTLYGPKTAGVWPSAGVSLGGGGGSLITSVNGQTGAVSLTASNVGADASGTASAAVSGHATATDPHGDRSWATGQFLPKTGGTVSGPLTVNGALTADSLVLPVGTVTSSKAAVFPSPTGAVSYAVWRAPVACTVVAVRGYRSGGTGVTVNAARNGSANLLATDLSLSTDVTWMSGGSVQNAALTAGDHLVLKITGVTGTPSAVTVQVDVQSA